MRYLFFSIIMIFFSCSLSSQSSEYTYQPFIMDGSCKWIMTAAGGSSGVETVISNEDTLILGKSYKKIYRNRCEQSDVKEYMGAFREENRKVFYFRKGFNEREGFENLVYDFNLKVGDRIEYEDGWDPYETYEIEVARIDTIATEGILRKQFFFDGDPEGRYFSWIEGIGNVKDLLYCSVYVPTNYEGHLVGVWHNSEALFRFEDKCTCDELMPVIEHKSTPRFRVLNNPVENRQLSISFSESDFIKLELYSFDGILQYSMDLVIRDGILDIPLTGLHAGNYILILSRSDNSRESCKVIIQ